MARNRVETILVHWLEEAAVDIRAGRWQAAAGALERTVGVLRSDTPRTGPGRQDVRGTPPGPPADWRLRRAMSCSRCGSPPGGWHEEACLSSEY